MSRMVSRSPSACLSLDQASTQMPLVNHFWYHSICRDSVGDIKRATLLFSESHTQGCASISAIPSARITPTRTLFYVVWGKLYLPCPSLVIGLVPWNPSRPSRLLSWLARRMWFSWYASEAREETKGRFCKRAALANVPPFPVFGTVIPFFQTSFWFVGVRRSVFCTLVPAFADGVHGTPAKPTLSEITLLRTPRSAKRTIRMEWGRSSEMTLEPQSCKELWEKDVCGAWLFFMPRLVDESRRQDLHSCHPHLCPQPRQPPPRLHRPPLHWNPPAVRGQEN